MNEIEYLPTHEDLREQVRIRAAREAGAVLEAMTPYVNGGMGDISPGHVMAWIAVQKFRASLYQAQQAPEDKGDRIPVATVARMVEEARAVAAVEAREAVLAEMREVRALESASAREKLVAELARIQAQAS
jgi:hypothetical protein